MEVEQPGTALLSISRFGSILRECSGDARAVSRNDEIRHLVRGERSEFRLPGENPEEYPTVTPFSEGKHHELPARLLRELSAARYSPPTTKAAATPWGACLLEMTDKQITAVGHRWPPAGEDGRARPPASAAIKMPTR